MKKNGFLTFIFAFGPGCGQMYQGYMRRGVSLLFWFALLVASSYILRTEAFLFLTPVVWCYSFFDSFNLRSLSPEQRAAMGDYFIPNPAWLKELGGKESLRKLKGVRILGWGLIIVGAIALYNAFFDPIYSVLYRLSPQLAGWMYNIPTLVIAVLLIVLGVWLLRRLGKNDAPVDEPDDYIVPPPPPAGDIIQRDEPAAPVVPMIGKGDDDA